jgi:hypothetical protein
VSAITAALSQIDRVAAEGDLVPDPAGPLELEMASDPILLPDGKRIYPPCLHGQPIDELALALLDMHDPAAFVQQLHRAAAQRGRLDPVFQDLSDHWMQVLQRLYPVWALVGPGLSDPGHIEIHSRTVYLDSEAAARIARRGRRGPARAAGDPALLRGRTARDCTPSTPSAGRSSTTSRSPSQATRPAGSSPSTVGCSKSRAWKPTASASSRPTRCVAGSSVARCRWLSPT